MEAQVNVSHQLRALLHDLVSKRTNSKYVVRQMNFSTHCIVLKMTYDMRDLTYFLTCEVNITSFFFLGSRPGLGVSLNIHINVIPPFGVTLLGRVMVFVEMKEQSTIMFKKFETGCQN